MKVSSDAVSTRVAKISISSEYALYTSLHEDLISWGTVCECDSCYAAGHEYRINSNNPCPNCGMENTIKKRVGRYGRIVSGVGGFLFFKWKKYKWSWIIIK